MDITKFLQTNFTYFISKPTAQLTGAHLFIIKMMPQARAGQKNCTN